MKKVRVVRPDGSEGEIPESAFEKVWKDRGYTLAEEQREEVRPEPEPDSTPPGESEVNAEADAEADKSGG